MIKGISILGPYSKLNLYTSYIDTIIVDVKNCYKNPDYHNAYLNYIIENNIDNVILDYSNLGDVLLYSGVDNDITWWNSIFKPGAIIIDSTLSIIIYNLGIVFPIRVYETYNNYWDTDDMHSNYICLEINNSLDAKLRVLFLNKLNNSKYNYLHLLAKRVSDIETINMLHTLSNDVIIQYVPLLCDNDPLTLQSLQIFK